jgi:hypothetical protein
MTIWIHTKGMIIAESPEGWNFCSRGCKPTVTERPHHPAPRSGATSKVSPLRGSAMGIWHYTVGLHPRLQKYRRYAAGSTIFNIKQIKIINI